MKHKFSGYRSQSGGYKMRAGKGGKAFGKSGGGKGNLSSKLLTSAMSPAMTPKGGGKMKGK